MKYTILGAIYGGINIFVCIFGGQISKPAVFCRHARRAMPTRFYPLPNCAYPCHPCHPCPVSCRASVSFRVVSNALTILCRAVPNFLKAGHDIVMTRTRNNTVSVLVSCLNPFRFQPCSYRSVPFPTTLCLNLEQYSLPYSYLINFRYRDVT
jgi:hypothetical protein